jgi:predicted secreted protein
VTPRTTLVALLFLPFLTAACTDRDDTAVVVEVSCDEFGSASPSPVTRSVSVAQGGTVVVRLCSNPSTGFEWEDADIAPPSVLAERAREFIPSGITMPGSAGSEQWTFDARSSGSCTVSIGYSRPWEGGEKDVWQFELEVTVD